METALDAPPALPKVSQDGFGDAQTLSLLHRIGQELSSILDPQELLRRVAEHINCLVDFQVLSLFLWDEEQRKLVNRLNLRFGQIEQHEDCLRLSEGICGAAASMRKSLRIPDVRLDPRFFNCEPEVEIRSELAVPMLLNDRLIGVVNLENVQPNAFNATHERILQTLGPSIAIALENARLYDQLRQREEEFRKDLRMARQVQQGLLPNHSPLIEGLEIGRAYRPAKHLGGDFYDFLNCEGDGFAFAVGDVSGKSTAAALYGSLAIGALRSEVMRTTTCPAELLKRVNMHLLQPGLDSRFLALCAASYDPVQRMLTVANAGLPRPLLAREGSVEHIPAVGLPLGLFQDAEYEQQSLALQPGDSLAIFSDGLHEASDDKEEEFGVERVADILGQCSRCSAQDIADSLLQASLDHSAGGGEREDDRTILVLKLT